MDKIGVLSKGMLDRKGLIYAFRRYHGQNRVQKKGIMDKIGLEFIRKLPFPPPKALICPPLNKDITLICP